MKKYIFMCITLLIALVFSTQQAMSQAPDPGAPSGDNVQPIVS